MTHELLIARCHLIAAEGRYHAARKRKQRYKHLHRAWVMAKARVLALEVAR